MKILVKVKTSAKVPGVEKLANDEFKVSVISAPEKGRANQELIELLAGYFQVSKMNIRILVGHKTKQKLIEIEK